MEIASALAALPVHPKRSILFMTFFGEERGLLGSRYYAQHPLVPPQKTIADLNLEQVGRTDATNGPQLKNASITGFDFSDLPKVLADAARACRRQRV
jgi:Zn-dependent M28 family amino/carboxypeptidase